MLSLLIAANVYSQDHITFRNNTKKAVIILEINPENIKYKDFDNQTGATYTILKSEIKSLRFQNGKEEILTENSNLAIDGNRVYLDGKKLSSKELIHLFQGTNALPIYKNSQTTKIFSYVFIIPGALGLGCGLGGLATGNLIDSSDAVAMLIGGGVLTCSGICFGLISQSSLKKSIAIYNDKSKKGKDVSLNIGFVNNRFGIRLSF
jgi:hypothetical protein